MSIYNISGAALSGCYDVDGNALNAAYDKNGNQIFSGGSDTPLTLKVMTYNVGQWYIGNGTIMSASLDANFFQLQYGTFQRNDVDICGIEEYTAKFSEKPRQASDVITPFFGYTSLRDAFTSNMYYGHGFAAKYPLSNAVENAYSVGTNYYYKADVNVGGKTIVLVVTHLSTNTTQRLTQIEELLSFLEAQYAPNGSSGAKVPVICLGDFNMDLPSYPDEKELYYASNFGMVNQAGFDGSAEVIPKDISTYEGHFTRFYSTMAATGLGLDNILFSPNIDFISAYVDTAKQTYSDQSIFINPATGDPKPDHMPLIATLQIN